MRDIESPSSKTKRRSLTTKDNITITDEVVGRTKNAVHGNGHESGKRSSKECDGAECDFFAPG